jgi:hypothetical protein
MTNTLSPSSSKRRLFGHKSKSKSKSPSPDSEYDSASSTAAAEIPQDQKAGWTSFLKSLAHMTGDLSAMTAPPCE